MVKIVLQGPLVFHFITDKQSEEVLPTLFDTWHLPAGIHPAKTTTKTSILWSYWVGKLKGTLRFVSFLSLDFYFCHQLQLSCKCFNTDFWKHNINNLNSKLKYSLQFATTRTIWRSTSHGSTGFRMHTIPRYSVSWNSSSPISCRLILKRWIGHSTVNCRNCLITYGILAIQCKWWCCFLLGML